MNYADIKFMDVANGDGIRTSLFVSGCRNHCPLCFNQEAQNFKYGKLFTNETIDIILESIDKPHIAGLSLLGGDPMEEENQPEILKLIEAFRTKFGTTKTIWMWSGYIWDKDLILSGRKYIEGVTNNILANIDYLVDGPFINSLKDLNLKFRGSSNQRIIDLKKQSIIE